MERSVLDRWSPEDTQVFYDTFQRKILFKTGNQCWTLQVDTLAESQRLIVPEERLCLAVLDADETTLALAKSPATLVGPYKGAVFPQYPVRFSGRRRLKTRNIGISLA